MDMSMINKDSTNVETNYHDISGVDLFHRLDAERQEPRLSDPVDSDDEEEEYEKNIQDVIARCDEVSKSLQEEKEERLA